MYRVSVTRPAVWENSGLVLASSTKPKKEKQNTKNTQEERETEKKEKKKRKTKKEKTQSKKREGGKIRRTLREIF